MLIPLLLSLSLSIQDPGGKVILPKKPKPGVTPAAAPLEPAQDSRSELERFAQAAGKLRRSIATNEGKVEIELKELGERFAHPADLAVEALRKADADLASGLVKVLMRFGAKAHGEELQLMLLARGLGAASRDAVAAMIALLQDGAKDALFRLAGSGPAAAQLAAREALATRVTKDDLPRVLALPRERGLELLAFLREPEARARLVQALSSGDPVLAQTACLSLLAHGAAVAPDVQPILEKPALDLSFGYAAALLVQLEERLGEPFLRETMVPHLQKELVAPETFFQVTAALALARLAHRSDDTSGKRYQDAKVVDALLLVAAPKGFVLDFAMLERPVMRALAAFAAQDLRGAEQWRQWWKDARETFVGHRARIAVTPENAAAVVITARDGRGVLRVFGEAAALPEASDDPFCVLDKQQLTALTAKLHELGFMNESPRTGTANAAIESLPATRVELQLGRARARTGFVADRTLALLVGEVKKAVDAERWQLYRDPRAEPEFSLFWAKERAWLAAHPDAKERATRLKDRIVRSLARPEPAHRARALEHLTTIEGVEKLLAEADGVALVAAAKALPAVDEIGFKLLELALLAPGDTAAKQVLDALDERYEQGGKERLARAFALLGPERVLAALADPRPRLRLAATLESVNLKDPRAIAPMLAMVQEQDTELRRAAITCLGRLRASSARAPLLESLPRFDDETRRIAWVALGRIGGEDVPLVLQAALGSNDELDRNAAIQALGECKDARAASLLAQIWAGKPGSRSAELALAWLKKQGPLLARPALRPLLRTTPPETRRALALLLGEMQDKEVVPDLIAMLDEPGGDTSKAAFLIATVTGVDPMQQQDRAEALRQWYRRNKDAPQGAWYLDALRHERIETSLLQEELRAGAGVGAVPELTRLLVTVNKPHLQLLTAALLRDVTEQDFGQLLAGGPEEHLRAFAERYRFYGETQKGAKR